MHEGIGVSERSKLTPCIYYVPGRVVKDFKSSNIMARKRAWFRLESNDTGHGGQKYQT